MPTIIAYHLGTGGVRASLHAPNGLSIGDSFVAYPTFYPKPKWHEQRPMDWWNGVCSSTRDLLAKTGADPGEIAAVALSGHSLAAVPLDREGNLLMEQAALLACVGILALGVTWGICRMAFLRPVRRLLSVASRLKEGNLAVRIPATAAVREFSLLENSFNTMAEALETRNRELENARDEATAAGQAKTANLQGPIVINRENMEAGQVILTDPRWKTKHDVLAELSETRPGYGAEQDSGNQKD